MWQGTKLATTHLLKLVSLHAHVVSMTIIGPTDLFELLVSISTVVEAMCGCSLAGLATRYPQASSSLLADGGNPDTSDDRKV